MEVRRAMIMESLVRDSWLTRFSVSITGESSKARSHAIELRVRILISRAKKRGSRGSGNADWGTGVRHRFASAGKGFFCN